MKPKRKVTIVYTYSYNDDKPCEAMLSWNPNGKKDGYEAIHAYGKSFAEVKASVIGKYMLTPESETIELGGK